MTHASREIPAIPPELGGGPREELAYRLRQQAITSQFGLYALACHDLEALFQRAVTLCAEGMTAEMCKVLAFQPEASRLLVRAGVGWAAGVVGTATLGADLESPAGYALATGQAVISNHLAAESRFRTPRLLAEHGVKRAINVIIAAEQESGAFGVLEVDSPVEGRFDAADLAFMQGFANLLGVAIERHRAEAEREGAFAQLDLERGRLRATLDALPVGVFIADADGRIVETNARAAEIWGGALPTAGDPADYGAYRGAWADTGQALAPEDWALARAVRRGETSVGEVIDIERFDGGRGTILNNAAPVRDGQGRVAGGVVVIQDLTERRAVEHRLREAVENQDLLNREVSHRVKNSLAMVASLLSLQIRGLADEPTRRALADARARITTIAEVHDHLWQQADVRHIDLDTFLRDLGAQLQATAPAGLTLVVEAEPARVRSETAIPLALLVNELVTNAFKYAYPKGGPGAVRVALCAPAPDRLTLEVSDEGVGLPDGFDLTKTGGGGLGTRLMATLVRQLDAAMSVDAQGPGTRVRVSVPV